MLKNKVVKKPLANQYLFLSGIGGARVDAHALQTKVIKKAKVAVKEKSCLDAANMTLGTSTSLLAGAATE